MARKEKPVRTIHPGGDHPIPPDLALWQKLMDELYAEIMAAQPDSPEEHQNQTKLMKRLIDGLKPADRKLLVLYCKVATYAEIRQEPEFRKLKIPALRRRACDLIERLGKEYARRENKKPVKKICAEFQLDLTDYAARQREYLTLARQKVLVGHIIKCPNCRQGFLNCQHIFASVSMVFQSPESKQRMKDLIKRLVSETR